MVRILSVSSLVFGFIVSAISAYLFSKNQINFESLVWIVIGSLSVVMIIVYQEITSELDQQKWEQKRLGEKLKIHERLDKIEKRLGI